MWQNEALTHLRQTSNNTRRRTMRTYGIRLLLVGMVALACLASSIGSTAASFSTTTLAVSGMT